MKKIFVTATIISALIISFLMISCSERNGISSCFPRQQINGQIFINGYANLLRQGWDYSKGEAGTGNRGLIIYHQGLNSNFEDVYIVYDRNAPHLCPDNDTTLEVITENGIDKIYCPKDGAKWQLQSGQPINSAPGNTTPWKYSCYAKNGILYVYN